jgi:hypothetical protein
VGATPATEDQLFGFPIQQRLAGQDDVLGVDAAARRKGPAKLKPSNFFAVPPRTEIFEERDADDAGGKDLTFKKKDAAAPANLGEISSSEWQPPWGWGGLRTSSCSGPHTTAFDMHHTPPKQHNRPLILHGAGRAGTVCPPNRRIVTLLFLSPAHTPALPPPSPHPSTAVIWSKTSRGRGGARDPAAAPAARAAHVLEELAQLDEGGEAAALMSAEGFKAYADDSIWVSNLFGWQVVARWGGEEARRTQGGQGWGGVLGSPSSVAVGGRQVQHP